jgi:hypothetical protein
MIQVEEAPVLFATRLEEAAAEDQEQARKHRNRMQDSRI